MVVFMLSMPQSNSWNGRWTGEDKVFAVQMQNRQVPKEIADGDYDYDFGDGWMARVSVKRMPASESRKVMAKSQGFCGYDWMVRSIIRYGEIKIDREVS